MSELLPREERIRWILERSGQLIEGGAEPVSGLVLPTGRFFPDDFEKSAAGVERLLRRIVKLAGLTDFGVRSRLVVPEEQGKGGCSSGACRVGGPSTEVPRVEQGGDGWTVNVIANELGNPTVLTTGMVRGVSHIFMREMELFPLLGRHEAEEATDLCGVLLGFGTLLCNGAYVYQKG